MSPRSRSSCVSACMSFVASRSSSPAPRISSEALPEETANTGMLRRNAVSRSMQSKNCVVSVFRTSAPSKKYAVWPKNS